MGIYGQDIDKLAEIHYDRMFDEYFAESEPKYQCECCGEWFDEEIDVCDECRDYIALFKTVISLGTEEQQDYVYDMSYYGGDKVNLFDAYIRYSGACTIEDDIALFLHTHKAWRKEIERKIKKLEDKEKEG